MNFGAFDFNTCGKVMSGMACESCEDESNGKSVKMCMAMISSND